MKSQTVVMRQVEGADPVSEEMVLPAPAPANEGKTTAAWTLTAAGCVGALLVAFGMTLPHAVLLWIGIIVIVGGIVASAVMRGLGYGQPRGSAASDTETSDTD